MTYPLTLNREATLISTREDEDEDEEPDESEPGSEAVEPSPENADGGKQMDDNIDGRRPNGSFQDQPT